MLAWLAEVDKQTAAARYALHSSQYRVHLEDADKHACRRWATWRIVLAVSVAEQPSEPSHLTVLGPQDALREAKPMPSNDEMAIDGLTDEEWDAFERALAER